MIAAVRECRVTDCTQHCIHSHHDRDYKVYPHDPVEIYRPYAVIGNHKRQHAVEHYRRGNVGNFAHAVAYCHFIEKKISLVFQYASCRKQDNTIQKLGNNQSDDDHHKHKYQGVYFRCYIFGDSGFTQNPSYLVVKELCYLLFHFFYYKTNSNATFLFWIKRNFVYLRMNITKQIPL